MTALCFTAITNPRRFVSGLLLLSLSAVLWAGCSKASEQAALRSGGEASADTYNAAAFSATAENAAVENPAVMAGAERTRKLVRRANLRVRVEDPEQAEAPLMAAMESCGAYAASVEIYENSRSYTIRVPRASYGELFAACSEIGKILYRSESAEDVTLNYYDLEGRLATKRELLKTFQAYLGKAANIEEIMIVEERIADLQQEIDWTGRELRSLADLVDYATIELALIGPVSSYPGPSAADRIADLFRSFGDYASTFLVILVGILIYGVPCILVLTALFWLFFGRIGLLKKLLHLAAGKNLNKNKETRHE
jgi:hypothetical protein